MSVHAIQKHLHGFLCGPSVINSALHKSAKTNNTSRFFKHVFSKIEDKNIPRWFDTMILQIIAWIGPNKALAKRGISRIRTPISKLIF